MRLSLVRVFAIWPQFLYILDVLRGIRGFFVVLKISENGSTGRGQIGIGDQSSFKLKFRWLWNLPAIIF